MPFTKNSLTDLRRAVGEQNVLTSPEDLIPYSFDGTAALQQLPACVVFATSTAHVSEVLRQASTNRIAVVTRGSGTGLSGGSVPSPDCIVLCLAKMDHVLELDSANLSMLSESGAATL